MEPIPCLPAGLDMAALLSMLAAASATSSVPANAFLSFSANRLLPEPPATSAAPLPIMAAANGPATAAKQAEQPVASASDKEPAGAAKQDEEPAASPGWIRPKKGLRTSEAIHNELQPGHQWPESMPLGPFGFKEAGLANAAAALKAWANNPFSDGGSFSLKKDTGVRVTEEGPRVVFGCSRSRPAPGPKDPAKQQRERGSAACGCKFSLTIEESAEGWVVASMGSPLHNHELARDRAAANAMPGGGGRHIPDDLLEMGQVLSDAGVKTGAIHSAFCRTVQARGDDITWSYFDIRSKWAKTTVDRELDATNFVEKLEQRRVQKGLFFSYHVDPEEGLCRVFWESDDGAELWQRSNASVLIIDTKHGTQRYGLKLGLMVSPDRNGATRIIAGSLLRHEDATSFGWVFEQFSACFRSKPTPKVVFSDSDPAIAAALAEKWAAAIHLLCIWHLFKVCWNGTCGEWLCLRACVVM